MALSVVVLALSAIAQGKTSYRAKVEKQFQHWVETEIWPEAKAAGVARPTFDAAFAGVTLDWDLPDLEPPDTPKKPHAPERQAEFRSPAAYFKEGTLNNLVKLGRAQADEWNETLGKVEKQYGVPRGILIGLWAKESSFGKAALPHHAIEALATESFMGRRSDYFRPELIAALQILQNGDVSPERMRSSWAGALGQPQLLPSKFLAYAVDFDGDGRRNIWTSVPDILASMANYLAAQGWKPERGWGLEASVPDEVACHLEGPEQGQSMSAWVALGVTQIDGTPLPVKGDRLGYLLMPAGRFGPSFIVTENFYTLKLYNESDLYALYIGHLSDRLKNNKGFVRDWRPIGSFSRGSVSKMQKQLEAQGHDVGGADGLVGFKTRIAVGKWQERGGLAVTCFPDAKLVESIH